jgi:hypothetical protein
MALASCNQEPEVIDTGPPDTQAEALKNAKPVQLPPSIAASYTYRCKDNSLIQVDFMNDQKTAVLHAPKSAPPIVLNAPHAGSPYVAPGYSVTGSGKQIAVARPGKGSQDCKA